jgi:hypothetical protein
MVSKTTFISTFLCPKTTISCGGFLPNRGYVGLLAMSVGQWNLQAKSAQISTVRETKNAVADPLVRESSGRNPDGKSGICGPQSDSVTLAEPGQPK